VVFILPGQKMKGKCYSEIKRLLIKEIPVPSQVVLASTISKGKNLRSIATKILISMNAKMGGIPWSISDLPFFDRPTMICGLDTFSQRGKKTVMALVASVNKDANRYFSRVKEIEGEFGDQLQSMFTDAFEAFSKACSGHYPQRIIIYRNGVGEGQK
jgi:aubergine-like protein